MMTFNHGLSGYVCSQVALPLLRKRAAIGDRAIGWAFFLGAMLPDADILTRVLLGRGAYFSRAWYGHRALSHSLLGGLLLALLAGALVYWLVRSREQSRPWAAYLWLVGCLWAGTGLHLVGDLFTPGWQLPIFWPLERTFGAFATIGWFSPYLLWLFLTAAGVGWLAGRLLPRVPALREWTPGILWGWYALATYRWLHFLLSSRFESWDQWHAYQASLLPEALIVPVTEGVRMLWYWFTR